MEELVSIDEAAVLLGCSRWVVSGYMRKGLLPMRGYGVSRKRGPKPQMVARADVESLKAHPPTRQWTSCTDDPDEVRQRIFSYISITPDGCWVWTGALAGRRIPSLHLGHYDDGRQRVLAVRNWLWSHEQGYSLPKGFHRLCEKSQHCIRPEHNPPKYDLGLIQYAVQALKSGQRSLMVAKQYGLPLTLTRRLLDGEEQATVRQIQQERTFWSHVDMTGEHWILLQRTNVMHAGEYIQAKHKAWLLSGRTLRPGWILRRICGVEQCIKPECQREIYAPGMRVASKKRGAATAQRYAEMVELSRGYGWSDLEIADLFGCSRTLVRQVRYKAEQRLKRGRRAQVQGDVRR